MVRRRVRWRCYAGELRWYRGRFALSSSCGRQGFLFKWLDNEVWESDIPIPDPLGGKDAIGETLRPHHCRTPPAGRMAVERRLSL